MDDDPRRGRATAPGLLSRSNAAGLPVRGTDGEPSGRGAREADDSPLRFGVLCAGRRLRAWHAWCLEELLEVEGVEPAVAVVPSVGDEAAGASSREPALWRWYRRRFLDGVAESLAEVDLDDVLPIVPTVRRGSAAAARIPEAGLDFLLDLGLGPALGGGPRAAGLEGAARHGAWTFRFGGRDDAGPPGFREILRGERTVEVALERVGPGGERTALHRGRLRLVDDSYAQTLDHLLRACAAWPARVCREILEDAGPGQVTGSARGSSRRGGRVPGASRSPTDDGHRADPAGRCTPSNPETLRFLAILLGNYVRNVLRWHFWRAEWNVGVAPSADPGLLVEEGWTADVTWMPPGPATMYLADPFGAVRDGRLVILAERYDHREHRGEICALDTGSPSGAHRPPDWWSSPPVLETPVHSSYPYLFRFEGDVYCVPETFQAREVRLHRARRFPDDWEQVAVLLDGFAAVDPTIFRHGDRWWLFCTDAEVGSQTVLHAWHADHPFGPWRPHRLNPLKTDVRSSRPAGTPFRHEGRLYRPAQDCSERYGGRIALNLVRRLDPGAFEEETVRNLEPAPDGRYPGGFHTVSLAGGCLLVDGMRRRFALGRSLFYR